MELPKEYKGTIYFYYWFEFDAIHIFASEMDDPDYILLGTVDIDTQFNTSHEEAVKQMVSNLNKQKQDIQADTQRRLNQIDEKINSLLAIEYKGGDDEV